MKKGTLPDDQKRAYVIPHEANQYVLMNDVLYHLFTKRLRQKVKETDIIQQLAVATSLRNDILLSYHDSIAAGCHMGVQKTYEAVRQKYFGPGKYQYIYDYVLFHVVQTNLKYLYTVSCNILYTTKTKYLRYVPILVNK